VSLLRQLVKGGRDTKAPNTIEAIFLKCSE
jgi:hypothetical protein